ncbi:MAG: shikimate dehydrogenase [Lentimicrobium sp.]|jgi:shikimate dehydrogenase|nr:shikimate dehydrogenase [Lentimicrobium sp.]
MLHFGLIGKKLVHSFSRQYFSRKFEDQSIDADYQLFELSDISEFLNLISNQTISGLNVTIPFKKAIVPYLDSLSEEAAAIGAVNTISFNKTENGAKIIGWNTDAPAFEKELSGFAPDYKGNALILGTGGAAMAASYVLSEKQLKHITVSRNPNKEGQLAYNQLNEEIIRSHQLIINATPVGTYPDVESIPDLPWQWIGKQHLLFDMVYNPELTRFLQAGEERGANVRNGLKMLHTQAELAWEIWQKSLGSGRE